MNNLSTNNTKITSEKQQITNKDITDIKYVIALRPTQVAVTCWGVE